MNDIDLMLHKNTQNYYGNEYLTYQKTVIENNHRFLEDQIMIAKFIAKLNIRGDLIDIGSGSCRWFPLFENKIENYYAIDTCVAALDHAPKNQKIIKNNSDVFSNEFQLPKIINSNINLALFSFFLSHFSNTSLGKIFKKLSSVDSFLIIDSLWSDSSKKKYFTKELHEISRKTSKNSYIRLPKRFLEISEITEIGKRINYTITNFETGNYWFVCLMKNILKLN